MSKKNSPNDGKSKKLTKKNILLDCENEKNQLDIIAKQHTELKEIYNEYRVSVTYNSNRSRHL